jgi:hypothetical protein
LYHATAAAPHHQQDGQRVVLAVGQREVQRLPAHELRVVVVPQAICRTAASTESDVLPCPGANTLLLLLLLLLLSFGQTQAFATEHA